MSKPSIGILLGAILGAFDGLTAWFTPAVRGQLAIIVINSTIKGIIAGIAIGFFARRFHSLSLGIMFGLAVGALLAFLTARFAVGGYYFQIMLPGTDGWVDRGLCHTAIQSVC
jgi:hypothetical protein